MNNTADCWNGHSYKWKNAQSGIVFQECKKCGDAKFRNFSQEKCKRIQDIFKNIKLQKESDDI